VFPTLHTNLDHVESKEQYEQLLKSAKNLMICCGRMGPMCLPVYGIMHDLKNEYPNVTFMDMNFDTPVAGETIRSLPQVAGFMGLPFTVYYKNAEVVEATTSIQSKDQVKAILDKHFS
jgi:thioredoxin 1